MNNIRQETVTTPRDARSECNIPTPVGAGLVPDRKGSGVGSVTSTPRDRVHPQSAENVMLEKRKNNLWVKYPTPAPCGQAQDLTLQGGGDMRTHLLLTTNFNAKGSSSHPGMFTRSATSPPLKGRGYARTPFAHDQLTQRIEHSWRLTH